MKMSFGGCYDEAMITHLLIFCIAFYALVQGSTLATKYAASVAVSFRLSRYTIGFLVIAGISILPETMVSLNAAFAGVPAFGLGTLLGSNVADLTLIFTLLVFLTGRSVQVEQRILKNHVLYPLILLLPIVLGLDGAFTRIEGAGLLLAGGIFYYLSLRGDFKSGMQNTKHKIKYREGAYLLGSLVLLLAGAHFVVESATALAVMWNITPVLIGLLIVGLGTTMPELFFAYKALKRQDDSLAIGDVLGTVLADATIVIGLLALVNPFSFPQTMIYIGGLFMVVSSLILFLFMRSGKVFTKNEATVLLLIWLTFILVEVIVVA